ncbi:MAG: 50S ribosomal protein L24 [Candidatus Binatia bacterium]|nr:MAG: 50S ribosomal protein L24 [Candidatus Binatia bacterium]
MGLAKIRKGDTVMVIAGRERGKTGKVLKVLPEKQRVLIERLNLVKRHARPRGAQGPQGIIEKEAPIHVSNVLLLCDRCNKPVRTGTRVLEDGRRVRYCKRCGEQVDR